MILDSPSLTITPNKSRAHNLFTRWISELNKEEDRLHFDLHSSFILKDNSLKEWSFRKAMRIQTYSSYDPIPVPFNLVSSLLLGLRSSFQCFCFCLRWRRERQQEIDIKDGNVNDL